jgi:1,6-anhydro-N-acetylmuramate kinase
MLALGLNSGSSFDGIDAVLVDITIGGVRNATLMARLGLIFPRPSPDSL